MAIRETVLVVGATGKQGRAVIRALLQSSPTISQSSTGNHRASFSILALTRNASSAAARRLVDEIQSADSDSSAITLVEGDLNDAAHMRRIFEAAAQGAGSRGIWGLFAVLAYPGLGKDASMEEKQGTMLADLALEFNIHAFVYSSSISPGPRDDDVQDASHRAKRVIESHCETLGASGLNWTILRPGFFMENFDGFLGSIAVALLHQGLGKDTTIAVVASDDIGRVADGVFHDPDRFRHKILSVTSGPVTMTEIMDSYRKATNKSMPAAPAILGTILLKMNSASQNIVKEIERNHVARSKGENPTFISEVQLAQSLCKLQTYSEWKSKTEAKAEPEESLGSWNKVSLLKLLTGRS